MFSDSIDTIIMIFFFTFLICSVPVFVMHRKVKSVDSKLDSFEESNESLTRIRKTVEEDLSKFENFDINNVFKKVENLIGKTDFRTASQHSEDIDKGSETDLSINYEENKLLVQLAQYLNMNVPYQLHYNFAVYKTFVEKKPSLGKYYIDKIKNPPNDVFIPVYRWKARISRLMGKESDAREIITSLEKYIKDNEIVNKDLLLAKLYRSRGFMNFNLHDYNQAELDFNRCLQYSINTKDMKFPYSYLGLAMCSYKLKKEDIVIKDHIKSAIELESYFNARNKKTLKQSIKKLEKVDRYYFSPFEKDTLLSMYKEYYF